MVSLQQGGTKQQLNGRAAAMLVWVSVYAEQINATPRGQLQIDWEGPSMRPKFTSTFDRISTDQSST